MLKIASDCVLEFERYEWVPKKSTTNSQVLLFIERERMGSEYVVDREVVAYAISQQLP